MANYRIGFYNNLPPSIASKFAFIKPGNNKVLYDGNKGGTFIPFVDNLNLFLPLRLLYTFLPAPKSVLPFFAGCNTGSHFCTTDKFLD